MFTPLPDSQPMADSADGAPKHDVAVVFDASAFRELLEALAADLDSVVSIYGTFVGMAASLIASLPTQNCAAQARTLHALRGSAAMIGAERMACLASRLQHVAARSVHPIVKTRIDELTGELEMFCEAFSAHAQFTAIVSKCDGTKQGRAP